MIPGAMMMGDPLRQVRPGRRPRRIALVGLGSRGDIQPLCVLGRELMARGHDVTLIANSDYAKLAAGFGLELVSVSATTLGEIFASDKIGALNDQYAFKLRNIRHLRDLMQAAREHFTGIILSTLDKVRGADLVVYNPMAFFAGELARGLGIPSVRASIQPVLPSRREPLSLFGGRPLGRLGNRLSYETGRLTTPAMFGRVFRDVRRASGMCERLHAVSNPLNVSLRSSHQLLAYSPALVPDPGDWPVPAVRTGFWFDEPQPHAALAPAVETFIGAGPPPIYVGFGSMRTNAERNTALVLKALALWGGRAILARGAGGLRLPAELPANLLAVGAVPHGLLFPRIAAAVHHGGSGTTGAVLRHGVPSVVLPILGDQLFFARRVAAVGAGESPIPLGRITAEELAARLGRVTGEGRYRRAAGRVAEMMRREAGVVGAADLMEALL